MTLLKELVGVIRASAAEEAGKTGARTSGGRLIDVLGCIDEHVEKDLDEEVAGVVVRLGARGRGGMQTVLDGERVQVEVEREGREDGPGETGDVDPAHGRWLGRGGGLRRRGRKGGEEGRETVEGNIVEGALSLVVFDHGNPCVLVAQEGDRIRRGRGRQLRGTLG